MRATEQSGVRSAGSSIGWPLVLAVLTALAVQLSVLTASASAEDLTLVEATQDEAVAAPVAGDDGTTSESPAANPVPNPEVTSPEPAAPSGLPAPVESPKPDAGAPARAAVGRVEQPRRPARRQSHGSASIIPGDDDPSDREHHLSRAGTPRAATGSGDGPTCHACPASRCAGIACAPSRRRGYARSGRHGCRHHRMGAARFTRIGRHCARMGSGRRVGPATRLAPGPSREESRGSHDEERGQADLHPSSLHPYRVHRVARCAAERVRAGLPSS